MKRASVKEYLNGSSLIHQSGFKILRFREFGKCLAHDGFFICPVCGASINLSDNVVIYDAVPKDKIQHKNTKTYKTIMLHLSCYNDVLLKVRLLGYWRARTARGEDNDRTNRHRH